jgi:hypothetical protein
MQLQNRNLKDDHTNLSSLLNENKLLYKKISNNKGKTIINDKKTANTEKITNSIIKKSADSTLIHKNPTKTNTLITNNSQLSHSKENFKDYSTIKTKIRSLSFKDKKPKQTKPNPIEIIKNKLMQSFGCIESQNTNTKFTSNLNQVSNLSLSNAYLNKYSGKVSGASDSKIEVLPKETGHRRTKTHANINVLEGIKDKSAHNLSNSIISHLIKKNGRRLTPDVLQTEACIKMSDVEKLNETDRSNLKVNTI